MFDFHEKCGLNELTGEIIHYIEVQPSDIEAANKLMTDVLGRSLDELPPQTRNLLQHIEHMVQHIENTTQQAREDITFTRRDVREHTGWGNTQLKIHIQRLEDMEYLRTRRGAVNQAYVYTLAWHSKHAPRHLPGLLDVSKLNHYDNSWSGQTRPQSGRGRDVVAPLSGAGRGRETAPSPRKNKGETLTSTQNTQEEQYAH